MNTYLQFSDSAKFADVARSVLTESAFKSNFEFFGGPPVVLPTMPYSIALFFNFLGISDSVVMTTSLFYYVLSIVFVFILSQKMYRIKSISALSAAAVGANYNLINYATDGASEFVFIFELLVGMYFISFNKWWGNFLGIVFMVLMYFTRPQAIIYILGFMLYYFILNFNRKQAVMYTLISFFIGTLIYGIFSKQGLAAIVQNSPGMAASDLLRGSIVSFDLFVIFKKVFYNLYNFYKALPEIMNPYLFALFVIGMFNWDKNKLLNSFKISTLFMVLATFFVTAITIPFYRYIHPVVPLVYIVAVITLYQIIKHFMISFPIIKYRDLLTKAASIFLVLFFAVGQTVGVLLLDSRFEKRVKNVDKPPIYVPMSYKLKEITDPQMVIVTNLDTWGSWYGERKTIWFPLEPEMILEQIDKIDAIYLTSYKIDDENYYMGQKWREMFNNPKNQKVLSDFKFVGEYEFKPEDNYDKESGKSVLFVKNLSQPK